jgi:hypothetical protein
MPRARNPEYYKEFKITAKGHGRTMAEANFRLDQDMRYLMKWIRGELIKKENWGDNNESKGVDLFRYCDMTFRQRFYSRKKKLV